MDSAEVEDEVLRQHLFGHIDKRHIRSHRITVLIGRPVLGWFSSHSGAVLHEGIVYININRCTIALRLPITRHCDLTPLAHIVILFVEVCRPLLRIPAPMEQPLSVETHDLLALFLP